MANFLGGKKSTLLGASPEPSPPQSHTPTTQIIVQPQTLGELNQKLVLINKLSQCAEKVQALEEMLITPLIISFCLTNNEKL